MKKTYVCEETYKLENAPYYAERILNLPLSTQNHGIGYSTGCMSYVKSGKCSQKKYSSCRYKILECVK